MDLTTSPTDWFRTSGEDLESAEYSRGKKHYGDYIAKLQHSEEKLAKGNLAVFSIIRGKTPNISIELYFKEISNGTLKTGTVFDFTHDWEEKFFKNVLNKEFLTSIGLQENLISVITYFKEKFDKFREKKPYVGLEDLKDALGTSKFLLGFIKQEDPLNVVKEKISKAAPEGVSIKIDNTMNYAIKKSTSAAEKARLLSNLKLTDRMLGGKLMIVLVALMPIHSLLIPHFKADFPSQEGIIYDEKNPIVAHGPEIESVLKELLDHSENIYNELKIAKSNYYIK